MTSTKPALLLTRPLDSAMRFSNEVRAMVEIGPVIVSPVLEIVPTGAIADLGGATGVIFSSANAVKFADDGRRIPAFCIGPRTTEAANAKGFDAQQVGANSKELIEFLRKSRPSGPLLHLRGEHSHGAIAATLSAEGLNISEAVLYQQQHLPLTEEALTAIKGERPVILPLFSPRSARLFFEQAHVSAPLWVVSISEDVHRIAKSYGAFRQIVANQPVGAAMCAAVAGLYQGSPPVEGP